MIFPDLEFHATADGSATLYRPDLDEHYHSVKGAMTESRHIFIDSALRHYIPQSMPVNILEIGFGTGLNALLSAMQSDIQIIYHSLELYPLSTDIILNTGYHKLLAGENVKQLFLDLHNAEWQTSVEITPSFRLHKIKCDLTNPNAELPQNIDIVYFDAFAPDKQPEMWSVEVLQRIFDAMKSGAIMTTYCAKGEIRRRLQSIGFIVERIPGPPGGKREILRASKP